MVRDSQRSRVYEWERSEPVLKRLQEQVMSLHDIELLAEHVCRDYGQRPVPAVKDGRSRRSACASKLEASMSFPRLSRNMLVALHELAHILTPSDVAWHGTEYVRMFIDLLTRYGHVQSSALLQSARRAGVKVARKRLRMPIRAAERKLSLQEYLREDAHRVAARLLGGRSTKERHTG